MLDSFCSVLCSLLFFSIECLQHFFVKAFPDATLRSWSETILAIFLSGRLLNESPANRTVSNFWCAIDSLVDSFRFEAQVYAQLDKYYAS